jgi:hypothetical protein
MAIRIKMDKVGNRIHIKPLSYLGGDLFQLYVANTKKVPGVRYSKKAGCQTAPLDLEVCRELRVVFGNSLVLGDAVTEWAKVEIEREKVLTAALNIDLGQPARLPRVERVAPMMYEALCNRGFQTADIAFAVLAGNHLNANQPGLGKTLETFGALVEHGVTGVVPVIGPQTSLWPTWATEVPKWMDEVGARAFVAGDTTLSPAQRNAVIEEAMNDDSPLRFLMLNAEMVRLKEVTSCPSKECDGDDEFCPDIEGHKSQRTSSYPIMFENKWAAVIGDEVHKYLMHSNPRSKKPSQVGLGFQRMQTKPDGMRIALSGTPMKGKPRLLWPTFHWLRPDLYTSQWRWSMHYFKTEEDSYAFGGLKLTDDLREDREEAFNRELGRMMIRRTKSELRKINSNWAPPDKRYAEVWLPMTGKQRTAYDSMAKSASARLEGGSLNANGVLAEMTRLRQFAGCHGRMLGTTFVPSLPSNKFEWLLGTFLPRLGVTGQESTDQGRSKVVVASQFTQFINLWADGLRAKGIAVHVLTGETKPKDRAAMQQDWQNNPDGPRVMLLNTNAGGVSITLDYADDLVIMDETWVPDDQEQVEDRVHRTSRTDHQVTIWYVRSEGTIERDIAGDNIIKDDRQKRSLDGRRGIEVARKLYHYESGE